MKICFTILILLVVSACTVYSQQDDDFQEPVYINPSNEEPGRQDTDKLKNTLKKKNPELNKKESFNEKRSVRGNENSNTESVNETEPANINTVDTNALKPDTTNIQAQNIEEEILDKELIKLAGLKGEDLDKAIKGFSQKELKQLTEMPAEKLAKILKKPEEEVLKTQKDIKLYIIKPYNKTPIDAPEELTSIPGVVWIIDTANYILTAGLEMTPKQRKKSQLIVFIIMICIILPESYRKYISKNK
jgi:hypothetical protein